MRINGFEQIKAFYSWIFNNPEKARPTHISLYLFLLNQNNRANWVEWFKCPYDLAMHGARIGNKGTYYNCLDDLKKWGIIDYKKGINNYKAPLIKLIQLYNNEHLTELVTVPLSEHLTEPQCVPLPVPLTGNKYKLLTNNIKLITDNIEKIIKFLNEKENFDFKKSLIEIGVEKNIIEDWLKVRKNKKASNTETAFNRIKNEIELSGLLANECIKIAAERSWQGFNHKWLNNEKNWTNSKGRFESDTTRRTIESIKKDLNRYG
jgi:hypothetical protein